MPRALASAVRRAAQSRTCATDPADEVAIPEDLLRDVLEAFARADEALRDGDLAGYQAAIADAQALLEDAADTQGISLDELINGADAEDDPDTAGLSDAELLQQLEEAGNGDADGDGAADPGAGATDDAVSGDDDTAGANEEAERNAELNIEE